MSLFKKFTDGCAGVAAFFAGVFFIRKYMEFEPEEALTKASGAVTEAFGEASEAVSSASKELPGKLEQFLTPTADADYSMLIPLIALLILSAVLGRVFRRLPYVCFGISLLPAMTIAYMYGAGMLYEQIGMFLILGALHVIGNLVDCLLRDREDGGHRAAIAAKISTAVPAVFCFYVMRRGARIPTENLDKLSHFENELFFGMTERDVEIMTRLGIMLLVLLGITLLLYNVYFIDAILSIIPFVYVIYQVGGEFLTFVPTVFFTLAAFCALSHILLCFCENNLSMKEQKGLREH